MEEFQLILIKKKSVNQYEWKQMKLLANSYTFVFMLKKSK